MKQIGLKKGTIFTISDYCNDTELMEWYENKDKGLLVVDSIEVDTNGVWVKDCPFRIDIDDVEIMDFKKALTNYIEKTIISWDVINEYNKGEHKAGEMVNAFFNSTKDIEYTKVFVEQLLDLINSDLFEFDLSDKPFESASSALGFKETCERINRFIISMKDDNFFTKWEAEITNI